jgi:hypothetical protein
MKMNMMVWMLVAFLASLFTPSATAGGWVPKVDERGNGGFISIDPDAYGVQEVRQVRTLHFAGRAPITVEIVMYLGPTKDSANYSWFTQVVLLNHVTGDWRDYVNLEIGQSVGLGHRVYPPYVTAQTGNVPGKNTLWAGVTLTSTEPFDPSGLTCRWESTDTGNIFGKTEEFAGIPLIYAGTSIGIKADGTRVTSGRWSSVLVTNFAFIGSACSTMNANTVQEAEEAARWMRFQKNFSITCTWSLTTEGRTYLASYVLRQDPTPVSLRIVRRYTGGAAEVIVNIDALGDPVSLLSAPTPLGPWTPVRDFLTSGAYTAPYEKRAFFRTRNW